MAGDAHYKLFVYFFCTFEIPQSGRVKWARPLAVFNFKACYEEFRMERNIDSDGLLL